LNLPKKHLACLNTNPNLCIPRALQSPLRHATSPAFRGHPIAQIRQPGTRQRCVELCEKTLYLSVNTFRIQRSPYCYSKHVSITCMEPPCSKIFLYQKDEILNSRAHGSFAFSRAPSVLQKRVPHRPHVAIPIPSLSSCRTLPGYLTFYHYSGGHLLR
jgi:hypothetical protein